MNNKENNNNDLDIFNNNNNNNNYTVEETNTSSNNNNIILEPLQLPSKELQTDFVEEISSEPIKLQNYKIDGEKNSNNNNFYQNNTNTSDSSNINNNNQGSQNNNSNINNNNNQETQNNNNNSDTNNNNQEAQNNNNSNINNNNQETQNNNNINSNPYSNPVNNPYSSSYNNNNSHITSDIKEANNQNIQLNNISAEQMEEQIRMQKRIEFLEQKKQKRKKNINLIGKGVKVASCVLVFGIGVGVGTTLSNNIILENEKENFKFDISNLTSEYSDNLILTSGSASPIFKNAGESVVNISTQSNHGIFITQTAEGSGSGIIYKIEDDLVYIITNNHVIEDAQYVTISVTGEEQISGKLVGTDATSDLAVFSVSKQEMIDSGIENISVAKFADSDDVEVGDFVYPIGNALGEGKTMTQGMISANNKQINIDGNNLTVLQTDAAINPGNSGGALIDSAGLVVGINTAKLASSQIEGIGYAIPSNIATEIANQIIENGYVQRPYFGVAAKTITQTVKEIYGIQYDGVLVSEVEKGSNAEKAGLVPTDIIISFNGTDIKTAEDLSNAIKSAKLNETFDFEVIRNNSEKLDLTVTFAIPTQQDNLKEFSTSTTSQATTKEAKKESTTESTTQSTTNDSTESTTESITDDSTESTTESITDDSTEDISHVIPETMTEADKQESTTESDISDSENDTEVLEDNSQDNTEVLEDNSQDDTNNYFSDEFNPENNIDTSIIMTPDEIVGSILESLIDSVVDPYSINPNIDFNE